MVQSGWSERTLHVGDVISVEVAPHKDSSRRYASLIAVTIADGTRYESFTPGAASTTNSRSTERSRDLSGTWNLANATHRGGAVGNEAVAGPTHWPLTERGRRQAEAFSAADDPMFRCVFYGVPRLAASVYSRRFSRSAERIVIEQEQYPLTRTIWLMADRCRPTSGRTRSGSRWALRAQCDVCPRRDDRILVHPVGNSAGLDFSELKRVVERYRLSSDGLRLEVFAHARRSLGLSTAPVSQPSVTKYRRSRATSTRRATSRAQAGRLSQYADRLLT